MRFAKLRKGEANRIAKKLQAKKGIIEQFSTWEEARKHKGLNPHKVRDTKTPDGDDLWSIKLDDKARMLVYLRGTEVVAWSIHPDHDSAYGR